MVEKIKENSLRKGIELNTIFLIIILAIILSFVISYAVSFNKGSGISTDSGSVVVQVIPDLGEREQGKIIVEIVET